MTTASLLLGLSRKPLSPGRSARAAQLSPGADAPSRRGLALLTEGAVAHALRLPDDEPGAHAEPLAPSPEHPDPGDLGATLGELWLELDALKADQPEGFLLRRGLLLPGPHLIAGLGRLRSRKSLRPAHLGLLGPRGAYLMALAPLGPYSSGDAFLPENIEAAFAKTANEREIKLRPLLLGFAIGTAQARGLSPKLRTPYREIVSARIDAARLEPTVTTCLRRLCREDRLCEAMPLDEVVALLTPGGTPAPARTVQALLLAVAGPTNTDDPELEATYRTQKLAADLVLEGARMGEPKSVRKGDSKSYAAEIDPARFQTLALAAHLTQASATASRLFDLASESDNRLLRRAPALQTCLAAMDAEDYARSLSNYAQASENGWGDPAFVDFLRVGDHYLSPEDSERLATDALRGFGTGTTALATRFITKLHPDTVGLLHDFQQKPHFGQLPEQMLSVLAKAATLDAALGSAP